MPIDARYVNLELLESVMLPMANLRFTLEDILKNGRSVDLDEFFRGLQIVHKNAAAIHDYLIASSGTDYCEQPERMTLTALQDLDAQISHVGGHLEIAS